MLSAVTELAWASGDLWRAVKHRDTYGKSFFVCGADGRALPYDEALKAAMDRVEKALEELGRHLSVGGCMLQPMPELYWSKDVPVLSLTAQPGPPNATLLPMSEWIGELPEPIPHVVEGAK